MPSRERKSPRGCSPNWRALDAVDAAEREDKEKEKEAVSREAYAKVAKDFLGRFAPQENKFRKRSELSFRSSALTLRSRC
jgi:hypothetical protein